MNNKIDLLQKLETSREAFLKAIEGLSEDEFSHPGVVAKWSLKDLLSHMTMWEAQAITLLFRAKSKTKPNTVHFGKETSDDLNRRWFEQHKDRPLARVVDDFEGVRNQTIRRIEDFSEKDLFDQKAFKWLGGRPLWKWIAEDTFEHEEEHRRHILAWRKSRGI